MKRLLLVVPLLLALTTAMFGQVTQSGCSKLSNTTPIIQLEMDDNAEHDPLISNFFPNDSNLHGVATGAYNFNPNPLPVKTSTNSSLQGQCIYKSGNSANCDTTCNINFFGAVVPAETGLLLNSGKHLVSWGSANAPGSGIGTGASCAFALVGGAASCISVAGGCFVTANVSVSQNGLTSGVIVNSNGNVVWGRATSATNNCGTQADPDKQQTAGITPVDPCLGGSLDITSDGFGPGGGNTGASCSPIIIDVQGQGFHLTSAAGGVLFDIAGTGHPIQIAWMAATSSNALLVLDRNGNGTIDSGKELFGNFTAQPPSPRPNGFLALAEFDKPENGGNGDGIIDERDAVFSRLRLWVDENHDGISQTNELHRLSEFGIHSLSLSYFESRRQDEFGNQFRYKARVNPGADRDQRDITPTGEPGRWAYDVFLVTQP